MKCALEKKGTNFTKLAEMNGIAGATLRNALRFKYPKAEKIIAGAIGVAPSEIWPSRYIQKSA
ncbi:helix-turn-helix domain-containing protein [Moritella viscosa]